MGNPIGFKQISRELPKKRTVKDRIGDYREFYLTFPEQKIKDQASRCMDCGVPTCHAGCPLGNLIPDWNDLVYRGHWKAAIEELHATNNFPEFTGRLCPAPCEEACVLGINEPAVTIEEVEKQIVERAFSESWIQAVPPKKRTGKRIGVVGSGPAGLAAAQQLNRAGHHVTVYERDDRVGGLLRYGIPDFKMEKRVIDRRIAILEQEGIVFRTNSEIGVTLSTEELKGFDAVVLCIGSTVGRELPVPGHDLRGIHLAMRFLPLQNRLVAGDDLERTGFEPISAKDKHVIVIGGGDTGSDCVGTCNRHGAKSVTNFELLPKPTSERPCHQPWPYWPTRLRTSSSHEEGVERNWSILTKEFIGDHGAVQKVRTVSVSFEPSDNGPPTMKELPNTEKEWPADLVLLALGFTGPSADIPTELGLSLTRQNNIETDERYMTSVPGVFAAGDARRGQSLIVWAISEGREAAHHVDKYLSGHTELPTKGNGDLPRI